MTYRRELTVAFVLVLACVLGLAPHACGQGVTTPAPKSGFVTTADGVKIHYTEVGTGPAILFVPGWTMPGWIWEKQIAHFAKTQRVVAIDPRSQGESSQSSEGLYPEARARDIKAVVDQLKLAPVVLVGWSMGVTEVAAYVDQFGTGTLAGLVLVDGLVSWDFSPEMSKGMVGFFSSFQKDRRQSTEQFVRNMYKKPQSEAYLNQVVEAALRTPTNSAMALSLGMMTADYRPALAKIDKPALIVVAASPFVPAYRDMHQRIAGSRLEIFEGAGHALFVDDPDRFNSLLDEFLKLLTR